MCRFGRFARFSPNFGGLSWLTGKSALDALLGPTTEKCRAQVWKFSGSGEQLWPRKPGTRRFCLISEILERNFCQDFEHSFLSFRLRSGTENRRLNAINGSL